MIEETEEAGRREFATICDVIVKRKERKNTHRSISMRDKRQVLSVSSKDELSARTVQISYFTLSSS